VVADAPRHLVLIGLMGAGKTSVGARCAAALGRPFVDTDELVEATSGKSVSEIFVAEGEGGFRALERTALADACASPDPLVIACGGGAVLDPENRAAMREHGVVVWLRASPERLAERVGGGDGRPLLDGRAPGETLERLAVLRAAAYDAAAHVAVDTDGLGVDEVTSRVMQELASCIG
jgi:shikimate kinase